MRRTQTLNQLETSIFCLRLSIKKYKLSYILGYKNFGKNDIYIVLKDGENILVIENEMSVREASVFIYVVEALIKHLKGAIKL